MSVPAQPSGASESTRFELNSFRFLAGTGYEVSGRWSGVRGRLFIRPELTLVDGERSQRLLADLEQKPWQATDGDLWTVAFPTATELPATRIELTVAPDITVTVPHGGGGRSPDAGRAVSTAPTAARARAKAAPSTSPEETPRPTRKRPGLGVQLEAARAELDQLRTELDRLRAEPDRLRAERARLNEQLEARSAATAARAAELDARAEALREQTAELDAREEALTSGEARLRTLEAQLRSRQEALEAREAALAEREAALAEREAALAEREAAARDDAVHEPGRSTPTHEGSALDPLPRSRDHAPAEVDPRARAVALTALGTALLIVVIVVLTTVS